MKIAVIGYGSIGKRHVKNLLNIKNIEIIICTKQKIYLIDFFILPIRIKCAIQSQLTKTSKI